MAVFLERAKTNTTKVFQPTPPGYVTFGDKNSDPARE